MNKEKIDFEKITNKLQNASGADIKAVCTEAGYFAIRNNRRQVKQEDFLKAIEKVKEEEELEKGHYFG